MEELTKITVLIPETKRSPLVKAVVKGDALIFVNKNKKKMSIPMSSVQYLDDKSVIYSMPRRRITKSEKDTPFEIKNGFYVSGNIRIPVNNVVLAESVPKKKNDKIGKSVKKKKKK